MRSPPGVFLDLGKSRSGGARAMAALRTAALRRSAFWAREGPNGLDSWRKKEEKGVLMLT